MVNKLFKCDQIFQILETTISKNNSINHNGKRDAQKTITNMYPKML